MRERTFLVHEVDFSVSNLDELQFFQWQCEKAAEAGIRFELSWEENWVKEGEIEENLTVIH